MESDQRAKPIPQASSSTRSFSFGMFLLCMIAAFFVDFVLAILIPLIQFAAGGFNIHGTSPEGGSPIYFLINLAILAYAAFKGRDAFFGFFGGTLLATLVMWPIN